MENRNKTGNDCKRNSINEPAMVLFEGEVQTFTILKDEDLSVPRSEGEKHELAIVVLNLGNKVAKLFMIVQEWYGS